jgi:hypothetical protein
MTGPVSPEKTVATFMRRLRPFDLSDLPLDVVILLIGGLTLALAGVLLFPVSTGALPYYEEGLYGLLLFIFALQTVTLGKTPFGDARRTAPVVGAGLLLASAGIVTCFVPGLLGPLPRVLLFCCFSVGGALLLAQMVLSESRLRAWMAYGGIFRRLAAACGAVYTLSILTGLLVRTPSLLTTRTTALVAIAFGASVFFLASILASIARKYPQVAGDDAPGGVPLPPDRALLLLTAVFMVLLGVLLIPVNFGILPFSGSAQLGLLVVIFSVQMLASGSTPVGAYPRTRLMVALGLILAGPGIVSCIVPEVLAPFLTVLVGVLNVAGGALALGKIVLPALTGPKRPGGSLPPILSRLRTTQIAMNLLSIAFGASMLLPGIVPGPVVGPVLAANGGALLYLLHILGDIDRMTEDATA